jgi:hypothetical protein
MTNIEMNLTPNNETKRMLGAISRIPNPNKQKEALNLFHSAQNTNNNVSKGEHLQKLLEMLNDHGLSNNVLRGGRARRTQRKKRTLRKKRVQRKTRR